MAPEALQVVAKDENTSKNRCQTKKEERRRRVDKQHSGERRGEEGTKELIVVEDRQKQNKVSRERCHTWNKRGLSKEVRGIDGRTL